MGPGVRQATAPLVLCVRLNFTASRLYGVPTCLHPSARPQACRKLANEQPISVADDAAVTVACGGRQLWLQSAAGATVLGDNSRLVLLDCQLMFYQSKAAAERAAERDEAAFGSIQGGANATLQLVNCAYFAQDRVRRRAACPAAAARALAALMLSAVHQLGFAGM